MIEDLKKALAGILVGLSRLALPVDRVQSSNSTPRKTGTSHRSALKSFQLSPD